MMAFNGGRRQIEIGDLPSEILEETPSAVPLVTTNMDLPEDGISLEEVILTIERDLIRRSLERTHGNKGQAARLLNLKRTTLVEKLKRLERLG